jgi:hypothetical protein
MTQYVHDAAHENASVQTCVHCQSVPHAPKSSINPTDLVGLSKLMALTVGNHEVIIGLIDGPVAVTHRDLGAENIREIPGRTQGACAPASGPACVHGTFTAGILSAKRGSAAPAICPSCTLLIRPIFNEPASGNERMPSATPDELATAIVECIGAGARVINLSVALVQRSLNGEWKIEEALDHAARRGHHCRGGREPGSYRQFCHYPASVHHSRGCVRPPGETDQLFESREFHRKTRFQRPRLSHCQPRS